MSACASSTVPPPADNTAPPARLLLKGMVPASTGRFPSLRRPQRLPDGSLPPADHNMRTLSVCVTRVSDLLAKPQSNSGHVFALSSEKSCSGNSPTVVFPQVQRSSCSNTVTSRPSGVYKPASLSLRETLFTRTGAAAAVTALRPPPAHKKSTLPRHHRYEMDLSDAPDARHREASAVV